MSRSHSRLAGAHLLLPVFCCPRTALQIGETISASGTECRNKCSTVEKSLAFKQGLVSSSTKVEERRRVTVRLSVSAPISLPVPLTSAVPPQRPPNGQTSPCLSAQHAAPAPLHLSKSANLPQIMPLSQPSYELIMLFPKSSNDEGYSSRPRKVISLSNTSNVEWCSPKPRIAPYTLSSAVAVQFSRPAHAELV